MAKYEVLEKSFIDGTIVEAGTVIEYDGEPGDNLKPIKKAKEVKEDVKEESSNPAAPSA